MVGYFTHLLHRPNPAPPPPVHACVQICAKQGENLSLDQVIMYFE
jgi:hypothetical protein